MNCFQAKTGQIAPQWYVIDASDQVVGRLAAQIAPILMGKHRPTYTPHVDTGDYIIVTNVDKVVFTGKKWEQKVYQRYSGYPGGQKEEVAWKLFRRHPDRILREAIRRMMPKSKLGRHMMDKLKLYPGAAHPHQAQQPIPLEPKSGRPAAAGILLAPERVVNPPRRKRREKPAPEAVEPETATVAAGPVVEAATPSTPPVETPETPTPETSPAPAVETPEAPNTNEAGPNPEPPTQG